MRPNTTFSDQIMRLGRRERLAINETVTRLLREEGASPAPAQSPFDSCYEGPEGSAFVDVKGREVFKKKPVGWLTLVRIPAKGVLSLVKPGKERDAIAAEMQNLPDGGEINILKPLLVDPNIANTESDLTLTKSTKTLGYFEDLVPIKKDTLQNLVTQLKLEPRVAGAPAGTSISAASSTGAAPAPAGPAAPSAPKNVYVLADGDVKFTYTPDTDEETGLLKLTVDVSGGFGAFDDLFGADSGVGVEIVKMTKRMNREDQTLDFTVQADVARGDSILSKLTSVLNRKMSFRYNLRKGVAVYQKKINPDDWEAMASQLKSLEKIGRNTSGDDKLIRDDLVRMRTGDTIDVIVAGKTLTLRKRKANSMLALVPLGNIRAPADAKVGSVVKLDDPVQGVQFDDNTQMTTDRFLKTSETEYMPLFTYDAIIKAGATKVKKETD